MSHEEVHGESPVDEWLAVADQLALPDSVVLGALGTTSQTVLRGGEPEETRRAGEQKPAWPRISEMRRTASGIVGGSSVSAAHPYRLVDR